MCLLCHICSHLYCIIANHSLCNLRVVTFGVNVNKFSPISSLKLKRSERMKSEMENIILTNFGRWYQI